MPGPRSKWNCWSAAKKAAKWVQALCLRGITRISAGLRTLSITLSVIECDPRGDGDSIPRPGPSCCWTVPWAELRIGIIGGHSKCTLCLKWWKQRNVNNMPFSCESMIFIAKIAALLGWSSSLWAWQWSSILTLTGLCTLLYRLPASINYLCLGATTFWVLIQCGTATGPALTAWTIGWTDEISLNKLICICVSAWRPRWSGRRRGQCWEAKLSVAPFMMRLQEYTSY